MAFLLGGGAAVAAPASVSTPADGSSRAPDTAVGTPTIDGLTHVSDIRRSGASAVGRRAHIQGVVTFFDPIWSLLFVQDREQGIFIFGKGLDLHLTPGDAVDVDGRVDSRDFAPSISSPVVTRLSRATLPEPLRPGLESLSTGLLDSQWIEISGIVRGIYPLNSGHLVLVLAMGPARVLVTVAGAWHGPLPQHLVNAHVRMRGVCGTAYNANRQMVGVQLFLPALEFMEVIEAAPADPFAMAALPTDALFRWTSLTTLGRRVRVTGEITWRSDGQLYLHDAVGDVAVTLWDASLPGRPGDRVDVVGFPEPGLYTPTLRDAVVRSATGPAIPSRPVATTVRHLIDERHDSSLVSVNAEVVTVSDGPAAQLLLKGDGLLLRAALSAGRASAWPAGVESGSTVRVTGICRVEVNLLDNPRVARGVELLLRTPADVTVIKAAPWWSRQRATQVLGGMAVLVIAGLGWILALRRRVTEQTHTIRQRLDEEQALSAKYQELFETANDVVVTCDVEGRLTAINRAGQLVTGYTPETALGLPLRELIAPASRECFDQHFTRSLAVNGGGTFEADLVRADGGQVSIEFSARPIVALGSVTGIQAIGRDVSSRKRTAVELEAAKDAAEAASRAKSEFVANISHEVRTPLNGILGMTELLLASKLTDDQRQYLSLMRTSADVLLHVINDVLDLSKIESGHLELVSVPFQLVDRLETVLEPLAIMARRKGLTFDFNIAPELSPVVLGDPDRIGQVLTNLVGNAIKFTHEGGISVTVGPAAAESGDAAGICRIRFAVTDTGIGILEDKQAVIFLAFTQGDGSTTRRYGGTGLGLAIAASLVRQMGGTLNVTSRPGEGSTFTAVLPFVRGQREAVAEDPTAGLGRLLGPAATAPRAEWARVKASRPLSVLLVEDNPVNQRLAMEILSRRGHVVVVAENGRVALERIERRHFDIVLMDVQMPEMNGLEATRAIRVLERSTGRHVPIVAMTAHAMSGDRERCLESGMDEYLTKPIRAEALVAQVERLAMAEHEVETTPDGGHQPAPVMALDEALGRVNGDRELLAEIAGIFLSDVDSMMQAVRAAIDANDADALGRAAHRLKGSIITFAAGPAGDAALTLELLGRSERLESAAAAFSILEVEVSRFIEALTPIAGGQPTSH
jgi:PAS domain S-box-containing protein